MPTHLIVILLAACPLIASAADQPDASGPTWDIRAARHRDHMERDRIADPRRAGFDIHAAGFRDRMERGRRLDKRAAAASAPVSTTGR